jgi:hypothetical protein
VSRVSLSYSASVPSVREDLERRITEELLSVLPTPVTKPKMEHIVGNVAERVHQWLADIYEEHSVSYQVFEQTEPVVARPSLEWLIESTKA